MFFWDTVYVIMTEVCGLLVTSESSQLLP